MQDPIAAPLFPRCPRSRLEEVVVEFGCPLPATGVDAATLSPSQRLEQQLLELQGRIQEQSEQLVGCLHGAALAGGRDDASFAHAACRHVALPCACIARHAASAPMLACGHTPMCWLPAPMLHWPAKGPYAAR